MATEIELKARVRDKEALRLLLLEKTEYQSEFEKDDTYWSNEEEPGRIRVRKEKRKFPDGSSETLVLATCKTKEVKDGIEINDEREFEVKPALEFEDFLRRMKLKPGAAKQKHGWAFSHNGINIELLEVKGLGWFLELEIVTASSLKDDETISEGKNRLLGFLDSVGIEREAIESRFYSELLLQSLI
jgi:adenylate cyclase class 2